MAKWAFSKPEIRAIQADALDGFAPLPLDRIAQVYTDWVSKDNYALMQHKRTGARFASLQSKRGNRAFAAKHLRKNDLLLRNFEDADLSFKVDEDHGGSCCLFLTGSYNPHSISCAEAWDHCKSHDDGRSSTPHLFRARLRKIFMKHFADMGIKKEFINTEFFLVSQVNCEAHESGYPHFHMVVILDRAIPVYRHESRKFPGMFTWRLQDNNLRKKIQAAWGACAGGSSDSFMDVQAAVDDRILDHDGNSTSALGYCLKYSMKTINCDKRKDVLTQAMLKFWNFRSIIGKKFLQRLGAYNRAPTRHDELDNELKLAVAQLQALDDEKARIERDYGKFAAFDGPSRAFMASYPAESQRLTMEILRLDAEKDRVQSWEYVGNRAFSPGEDQSSMWDSIKTHNQSLKLLFERGIITGNYREFVAEHPEFLD